MPISKGDTPDTVIVEKRRRSNLISAEKEKPPTADLYSNLQIVPYKADFFKSKSPIIKWCFSYKSRSVILIRKDFSTKVLHNLTELERLSDEDLLTIQDMIPEKRLLSESKVR